MKEWISQLDHRCFHALNRGIQNPFLDWLMPLLRESYVWVPLYAVILVWLIYRFRQRAWWPVVIVLFTFLLTDQISAHLIKSLVHRLRPCHTLSGSQIHLLVPCGAGFSFVSSHAANTFGFATIMIILMGKPNRWLWLVAPLWATAVSLAQIYVGLHYPVDVLGGAMLGIGTGLFSGYIYHRFAPQSFH